MVKNIFYEPAKKLKNVPVEMIMKREAHKPEELLQFFLEETKRCYCTYMRFPSRVVGVREQQAQQQNYDYFVHTMAEMIKKYAPEITE